MFARVNAGGGSINQIRREVGDADPTSIAGGSNRPIGTSKYAYMGETDIISKYQAQGSTHLESLQLAPTPIEAPQFKCKKRLQTMLREAQDGDPIKQMEADEKIREEVNREKKVEPPSVLRKRQDTLDWWGTFILYKDPGLDLSRLWDHDIVLKWAAFYLRWRVSVNPFHCYSC